MESKTQSSDASMLAFGSEIGEDEIYRALNVRLMKSYDEVNAPHIEPEMTLIARQPSGYDTYDIRLWTQLQLPVGNRKKRMGETGGNFPNMTSAHLTVTGTHDHFQMLHAMHL